MVEAALVVPGAPVALAVSVYPVPAMLMPSPGNVATPAAAATVVVPERVPLPGFAPSATVTLPVKAGSVLPRASSAVTCKAGVIDAPAAVLVGCTVNTSCVAVPGVMVNAALVVPVAPVALAVSV